MPESSPPTATKTTQCERRRELEAGQGGQNELPIDDLDRKYRFAGRRPKEHLDRDTIETVCEKIAGGCRLVDVAGMLSIEREKLWEWRDRGEKYRQNGGPEADKVYYELVLGIEAAGGVCGADITHRIWTSDGAEKFAWLKVAEARMPDTYGKDAVGDLDVGEDGGDAQFL